MGGRAGRVVLDRLHKATVFCLRDLGLRHIVREIKGHERLEVHILWQRCENALAVGLRQIDCRDGRLKIGHDNGARKTPRRVGECRSHHRAIPKMEMPIVGAYERQSLYHGYLPGT